MSKEEMKNLIEQVWSDSMSDNGAIWESLTLSSSRH